MWSLRTGAELTDGQPKKSLCHKSAYATKSFFSTYCQYARSRCQSLCSSAAVSAANICPAITEMQATKRRRGFIGLTRSGPKFSVIEGRKIRPNRLAFGVVD